MQRQPPWPSLVIQLDLEQPGITAALVGARNARQVDDNVGALNLKLSKEEIEHINSKLNQLNLRIIKMARNAFKEFPGTAEILEWYSKNGSNIVHEVNGHFHTPYSFSAFRDLRQVFDMAREEQVKILGINDFYTMAGYEEFQDLAVDYKLIPDVQHRIHGTSKGGTKKRDQGK